jgi:hypothetical protein
MFRRNIPTTISNEGDLPNSFGSRTLVERPRKGCAEKLKTRHSEGGVPEESDFFMGLSEKQIPPCARDDSETYFFQSL